MPDGTPWLLDTNILLRSETPSVKWRSSRIRSRFCPMRLSHATVCIRITTDAGWHPVAPRYQYPVADEGRRQEELAAQMRNLTGVPASRVPGSPRTLQIRRKCRFLPAGQQI